MTGITKWEPSLDLLDQEMVGATQEGGILLLPRRVDQDGIALYPDNFLDLIKKLKLDGMDVQFGHSRDSRKYLSEYSSVVLVSVALAVLGNFTYDMLKRVCKVVKARVDQIGGNDNVVVEVKIANITKTEYSAKIEGFSYKGPASGLERAVSSAINTDQKGGS